MRDRIHEPKARPSAPVPAAPPWRLLRWVAVLPALMLVQGVALSWQYAPVPSAARMNVAPVTFLQPAPVDKPPAKQPDKQPDKGGKAELPPPRGGGGPNPADPLAGRPILERLGDGGFGGTPKPSADDLKEYGRFVERFIDPRNTLDVVVNRTRLMVLKEVPTKIQVADERTASVDTLSPKELSVQGLRVGTTVLNLFFTDPKDRTQKTLSYLVRVIPDPEEKARLERVYKVLEKQINDLFCDSFVKLTLVGDKLAVAGQAKDIFEGTQILRIARANAPGQAQNIPLNNLNLEVRPDPGNPNNTLPGLGDFLVAGGPNIINLLRVPGEQQVMLKVIVAEVNRSAARSIGLNFNITNNNGVTVFAQRTGNIAVGGSGAITGSGLGSGGIGGGIAGGLGGARTGGIGGIGAGGGGLGLAGLLTNNLPITLDGGQIPIALNALRELNYARSLAEPNLVAINGQSASFQAGGQFPVPVVSTGGFGGGSSLQGVNFVPFGVQLSFTPFITDRDRVRLQVQANVSTRDLSSGSNFGGSGVPGLNTRNFNTTVELREGQTLAVAGLIQNNLGSQADRVPGVGDLPVLNRIFGFDRIQSAEQELVILITPELVRPLDKKELLPLPLPGSDLLEPSDLEFYVLGRLENRKGLDYRSQIRNSAGRIKAYHTMESMYLFGPSGFSDAPPPAGPGAGPTLHGPLAPVPAAPAAPTELPTLPAPKMVPKNLPDTGTSSYVMPFAQPASYPAKPH